MQKIMIGLRVSPEFKKKLEEIASEEHRSLANFINHTILHYLKNEKGLDWKEPSKKNEDK